MPASALLAAYGSVYGPDWVNQLLGFVTSFEVSGGAITACGARQQVACYQ